MLKILIKCHGNNQYFETLYKLKNSVGSEGMVIEDKDSKEILYSVGDLNTPIDLKITIEAEDIYKYAKTFRAPEYTRAVSKDIINSYPDVELINAQCFLGGFDTLMFNTQMTKLFDAGLPSGPESTTNIKEGTESIDNFLKFAASQNVEERKRFRKEQIKNVQPL